MNNAHEGDLFDLMMRWDLEAKEIPSYIGRHQDIPARDQRVLLIRRTVLRRLVVELRDVMQEMTVRYRGVIAGAVVIESEYEEDCWARVGDEGTVEFQLSTAWVPTDSAIAHSHED